MYIDISLKYIEYLSHMMKLLSFMGFDKGDFST